MTFYPYPPVLQEIRHKGLEFRNLIHRRGGGGLKWDLIRDHEEDRKFGQSTLHIHWSGGGGDYLLPHQDVKEKHTNVIISVMWGATLLFWKHGKKMRGEKEQEVAEVAREKRRKRQAEEEANTVEFKSAPPKKFPPKNQI